MVQYRDLFSQTSNRTYSRGLQTKRREARNRLTLELLEPRHLLSAELGVDSISVLDVNQPSITAINWFESIRNIERVPQASLANVDPSLPPGSVGPLPLAVGEWMVQLTGNASRSIQQIAQANQLLSDDVSNFTTIRGLGHEGLLLVRAQGGSRIDIENSLARNANVSRFSLNQLIQGQLTPNDSRFGEMIGLNNVGQFDSTADVDVNAPEAWAVLTRGAPTIGSTTVVVGVIDSGVDATHPDLYLNIWINQGEIPVGIKSQLTDIDDDGLFTFYDLNDSANRALVNAGRPIIRDLNGNGYIDANDLLEDPFWADGIDTDRNGFTDDFFGWNFRTNADEPFASNNPSDVLGHGSHVTGTIAAIGNNGVGVTGLNWRSSIMALKFLDQNNQGNTADAIAAINYATMMSTAFKVNVVATNNSWGQAGGEDLELRDAIERSGDANILFVAAAGNGNVLGQGVDNDVTPFYPASYTLDNIIAVAAGDPNNQLARFSNFGRESVDIVAPGVGILSTLPGGRYGTANGTSMATPHVTGTAALINARLPGVTVAEVKAALIASAKPMPETTPPHQNAINQVSSGGRLDAFAALTNTRFAPRSELLPIVFTNPFVELGAQTAFLEIEPNDSVQTPQDIDPAAWNRIQQPNIKDSDQLSHLSITASGDETADYYGFTVTAAGERGIFDIDDLINDDVSNTAFDGTLDIYDANGQILATSFDQLGLPGQVDPGSNSGLDPFLEFVFPNPGRYVIGVTSGPNFGAIRTGVDYTLHVSVQNHPIIALETLDQFFPNNPPQGTLQNIDSVESAPWNQFPQVDIQDSGTIPHLSIVGGGDGGADVYEFTVTEAGLRGVFDIDHATLSSTPITESEPNQTFTNAQNLDPALWSLGTQLDVTSSSSVPHITLLGTGDGTVDFYSFTVSEPGRHGIFDVDNSSFNPFPNEVEPNDSIAAAQNIDSTDWNLSERFDISQSTAIPHTTILATGNDTVDVFAFTVATAGSRGIFDIDNSSFSGNSIQEMEPNDTLAAPQNIDAEAWSLQFDGNITDSSTLAHLTVSGTGDGSFDYYSFAVSAAGRRGVFDIDQAEFDFGFFDTELFLYDNSGQLLTSNDDHNSPDPGSSNLRDSYIDYTFSAPGTYIIAVGKFQSNGEPGGATGQGPEPGDFYTLQISIEDHVIPSQALDLTLTLHAADGTVLATSFDLPLDALGQPIFDAGSFSATDPFVEFLFTTPGNYYITVSSGPGFDAIPFGASYTLHTSIDDHDTGFMPALTLFSADGTQLATSTGQPLDPQGQPILDPGSQSANDPFLEFDWARCRFTDVFC